MLLFLTCFGELKHFFYNAYGWWKRLQADLIIDSETVLYYHK